MSEQEPTQGSSQESSQESTQESTQVIEEELPSFTTERTSSWHPTHIPHLVMGLALLGLVTVWAIVVPLDAVDLHDARWLLPLPWLVAGAAGLVATIFSGRRRS